MGEPSRVEISQKLGDCLRKKTDGSCPIGTYKL